MPEPALKDSKLDIDGRVAVLTFNRDDMRNALTGTAIADDICAALEWANAGDISVLILTGTGAAFTAAATSRPCASAR
jgi:enoyl-CoA hydratase/carnithine racemase